MQKGANISHEAGESPSAINPYAVDSRLMEDELFAQNGLGRIGDLIISWCRQRLGLESAQDVELTRITTAFAKYFEIRPTARFFVKAIRNPGAVVAEVSKEITLVNESLPQELTAHTCKELRGSLLFFESPEAAFAVPSSPLSRCSFLVVPKHQAQALRAYAAQIHPADVCKKIVSMNSFARALEKLTAENKVQGD